MYKHHRISMLLPAYNEEEGIKKAIGDFFSTKVVDEIIVVDNNSKDKTAEIARKTEARLVNEKRQGYGYAIRRGLAEAKGDIIFTCEPDGTFEANDIFKFLAYVDEFDVVLGSRTSKSLIWSNAKMNWFLRLGNWFVAKLLEYVHNGPSLTDVGCTFKAIKKEKLRKIMPNFRTGKSAFSPEFMIWCIKKRLKIVEIPVNYKQRIGESKITSSFWKSFKLGIIMIFLIFRLRLAR